jgi:hypothetical protein
MADDGGDFTTGTVVTKAFVDQVYDVVDDQCHSSSNPTIKPKATTDEVVTARGSKASLDARLDVALNEDGTPKAVAGQATETQVSRAEGKTNLVRNGEMEFWDSGSAAPEGWTLAGTGASIARSGPSESDTTVVNAGPYAAKVTRGVGTLTLTTTPITTAQFARWGNIKGRKVTASAQVLTSAVGAVRIVIDDGVTTTASAFHTGGGAVETLAPAVHTISNSGTKLSVYLEITSGSGNIAYVGGVVVVFGDIALENWIPDSTRPARMERFGDSPNASNVGTSETDLATTSIPPLDIDGEGFDLTCDGALAANTNTKTLRLDIAGQKVTLLQNTTNVANNVFTVRIHVARRTTSVVEVYGVVTFNAASGAAPTVQHLSTTLTALDMTRTQQVKITGQSNTASGDVTLRNINGLIDRN